MKLFIYTFLFLLSISLNAQKIEIKEVFYGYRFYQDGKKLDRNELKETLGINSEAYQMIKKGRKNLITAIFINHIGSFLFGWSLGTSLSENINTNWAPGIPGGIAMIVSFPIVSKADKKIKKGIELYNSDFTN